MSNFFQLKFGHFPSLDPNPNLLKNFCLLKMRPKKKFLENVQRYKGGKAVQQKSKVELLFSQGASLTLLVLMDKAVSRAATGFVVSAKTIEV